MTSSTRPMVSANERWYLLEHGLIIPGYYLWTVYLEFCDRYIFAAPYVKDKIVLDIACGIGYGSSILKKAGAKRVIGADILPRAIEYANTRYTQPGVSYLGLDANQGLAFGDASFDVITSFETIEHLDRHEEFNRYVEEIRTNKDFNERVLGRLEHFNNHLKNLGIGTWAIGDTLGMTLYAMMRFLKPEVIMETGVSSGLSSSYLLLALEKNNKVMLYSIDLPLKEVAFPEGAQSGWIIPDDLRYRWVLSLGKSSSMMPAILENLKSVDIFFHDSEHTYENMTWEYQAAWPYLQPGSLLLSHDINRNHAFSDFRQAMGGKSFTVYAYVLGGIRKR